MKIKNLFFLFCFLPGAAFAADSRPAIFSTSTDWEALTGLRLHEYKITFGRDETLGNIGMELYYLDGFPCYGQTYRARAWVSPSRIYSIDDRAVIRITCLAAPDTVQFAYRAAEEKAVQGKTTGLLTCAIGKKSTDIKINLAECTFGKEWKDI